MKKNKLTWIIDGSINKKLHRNARLKPAEQLAKIGWEVTMITSGIPDAHNYSSIRFRKVEWPKIYFCGAVIYYLKILWLFLSGKIDTDIIFFQIDSISWLLLAIPVWQKLSHNQKYNVIIDFRSLPMETDSLKGKLRSLNFYIALAISKKMDIPLTAITEKIARVLKISKKQLAGIWPSGAEIEDFKDCFRNRQWPEENDPVRFIYLGVMRAERNLISVIEGACIARKKGINLAINIIGDGDQKVQLQEMVKKKGADFVNIEGPFPYYLVPNILTKNHIGILPFPDVPKMNVSSAIKMFEYMAAGMPVMATKIEAHHRVFKDHEFVFWTGETPESMAEAMAYAVDSKATLSKLGKQAMDYSKSWTWAESAQKLSKALEKVISRKKM